MNREEQIEKIKNISNEDLVSIIDLLVNEKSRSSIDFIYKNIQKALLGKEEIRKKPYSFSINSFLKDNSSVKLYSAIYDEAHRRLNPNREIKLTDIHIKSMQLIKEVYSKETIIRNKIPQISNIITEQIIDELFEWQLIEIDRTTPNYSSYLYFMLTNKGMEKIKEQEKNDIIKEHVFILEERGGGDRAFMLYLQEDEVNDTYLFIHIASGEGDNIDGDPNDKTWQATLAYENKDGFHIIEQSEGNITLKEAINKGIILSNQANDVWEEIQNAPPKNMRENKIKQFIAAINNIPEVLNGYIQIDIYNKNEPDSVELGAIWSHVERKKGHATNAMKAMLEIADEYNIDIYGEPYFLMYDIDLRDSEGATDEELDKLISLNDMKLSNEQLLNWYQNFGFELTGNNRGDQPEIVKRANSPKPTP